MGITKAKKNCLKFWSVNIMNISLIALKRHSRNLHRQPEVMSEVSGLCMYDMLRYAYAHLEECKLILCCSEGTKFSGLIDEMVEIEVEATHSYQKVLQELGRPSPKIDPTLEHILITGMFHTFFELVIHEMPLNNAENYVKEMRAFYTAGWMKIMGQ